MNAAYFLLLLWSVPGAPRDTRTTPQDSVTTVRRVDLERYGGLWYEVARIPNRFQEQCVRGTTAEYTLREDGRITVVNRCFQEDGRPDEAEGVAKVIDTATNAKLQVSFVSFLGWRPFWGDYWVIGLDEDYQGAVVGTPTASTDGYWPVRLRWKRSSSSRFLPYSNRTATSETRFRSALCNPRVQAGPRRSRHPKTGPRRRLS